MPAPSTVSDPERIRALAHPVRLELLDLLRDVEEATATECAARVGESVASCSFHLRILEKYGYIERAERRGREKPWRVRERGSALDARPDRQVPGSLHAVQELAALTVARESDRVTRYLARAGNEPDEWLHAATISTAGFWATAEELRELSEEVQRLVQRFHGRAADPAQRPEGARHARLFATVNPDPDSGPDRGPDSGSETAPGPVPGRGPRTER